MNKRLLFFILSYITRKAMLLALYILLVSSQLYAAVVDRTLAIVNSEHILLSDFEKVFNTTFEQFKRITPTADLTPAKIKELKQKILKQMVDDKILLQEAKKCKITVSKREIEQGIKKVRQRFPTEEAFQTELSKEDIDQAKLEERIKDQISVIKLIELEVRTKVAMPTEEQTKQLFEIIEKKINGEGIGDIKEYDSKDIESLAKLIKRNFSELVRTRHILAGLKSQASMKEKIAAKKKIKEIQKKLKEGEDFSELAKKYSDDTGTKNRGGDLGYFTRGEMVPEFEKTAFSLNVGGVSDIVETEFGYHIIKLEEKKAARKISYNEIKNDLMNYIALKAQEKKYEQWLKSLREKSTIKINPID